MDESAALALLREAFGKRLWIGASLTYGEDMRGGLARRAALARAVGAPLIATNDALMHAPERRALADVLTCIREKTTLEAAGLLTQANAERHLKAPHEMARLFASAPQAVAETIRFLDGLAFSLDELKHCYPEELREGHATPQEALEAFAWQGAEARYPDGVPERTREALEYELALIASLDYAPYFLTVHDIVRFARSKGILCQGRGSAANSAVCYCLRITEVNPANFDLLFERFISPERNEPPDIDVDFEHERREEVIQYIYERYRARARQPCRRSDHLSHALGDPRDGQGVQPIGRCHRRSQRNRLGPGDSADRRGSRARDRDSIPPIPRSSSRSKWRRS